MKDMSAESGGGRRGRRGTVRHGRRVGRRSGDPRQPSRARAMHRLSPPRRTTARVRPSAPPPPTPTPTPSSRPSRRGVRGVALPAPKRTVALARVGAVCARRRRRRRRWWQGAHERSGIAASRRGAGGARCGRTRARARAARRRSAVSVLNKPRTCRQKERGGSTRCAREPTRLSGRARGPTGVPHAERGAWGRGDAAEMRGDRTPLA